MAHDTLLETMPDARERLPEDLPICLRRDRLTSPYFPQTSRELLALVILLCLVFLAISLHRLNHTDLWGHLNLGRWIATQGHLPQSDPLAAHPADGPQVNVPWLSQLLGYLLHTAAGNEGLVLCHALLVTASSGLVAWSIVRRGQPLAWGVAGAAAAMLVALPIVGTIRPQLLGMLGVPLVLGLLSRPGRWWVDGLFLPLFTIWANLHGSFAVGLLLVAAFGLTQAVSQLLLAFRHPRQAAGSRVLAVLTQPECLRAIRVCLFSLVGACLNPLGPWLLIAVATFGRHEALQAISEWQPLSPWSLSGALFFGSLAVTAVLLRNSDRRLEPYDLLLLLIAGVLTLAVMRMLVWWSLVWPWAVAPLAHSAWRRMAVSGPRLAPSSPREASMRTLIAIAFVFMTLLMAPPSQALLSGRPRGLARVTGASTPWYVADELERRQAAGNLLAPMDWADYLVWKTQGELRPLVYSHVHLLRPDCWQTYRRIQAGDPQWLELARQQALRYLVIDRQRCPGLLRLALAESRRSHPPLTVLYRDRRCVLVELH